NTLNALNAPHLTRTPPRIIAGTAIMPARKNQNRMESLALAVAGGMSVASWARNNGVGIRTCYDWTATEEFKARVAEHRRRFADQSVGALVKLAINAVAEIAKLMSASERESIRLAAAKAILDQLVAISSHVEIEERLAALEAASPERTQPQ